MTMNDTTSIIATRQKRAKGLLLAGLIALALISMVDALLAGNSLWGSLIWNTLGVILYRSTYNNYISWLVMPWPRRRSPIQGKHVMLTVLTILLSLLGILIMGTMIGNLEPKNRNLFWSMGVIPYFVIDGWVFLAIVLGATDRLPAGWETFWRRSLVSPARFDANDRRALAYTVGGLMIGNSINVFRAYQVQGIDSLGGVILGALLVDLFALGVFFWIFRRGQIRWGLFWLGLWTVFNYFSIGIELAQDLGMFFTWLPNRILGLLR